MKSILDPSFRYTSSVNTDLHKTFAKVREAQRMAAAEAEAAQRAAAAEHEAHRARLAEGFARRRALKVAK